ncbi:Hypothetical Protein FCC1311_091872 [Hondaea fermentalgiana]|uniref:Uncharacterized protein n=1 Tax=Hondaea fermentalgiana TaxID=2315210 RepID=A0A2R5GX25_9STRA|nr:Hypothetical Protein FCC1311_091872 [Hondaea fermentalgiana]|eukprot:GBG32961.1 Hypothetical Protein FCC1311_091872 [Hondaea fermentalgiana]
MLRKVTSLRVSCPRLNIRQTFVLLLLPITALLLLSAQYVCNCDQDATATSLRQTPTRVDTIEPIRTDILEEYELIICTLVRDSASTTLPNLRALEVIAKAFKSSYFIIVENDSEDGTDKLLASWVTRREEHVRLISRKMEEEMSQDPSMPAPPLNHDDFPLSALRFHKMAVLRNLYVDVLDTLPQMSKRNTLVAIVDLDLKSIPIDDTLRSLSAILSQGKDMRMDWDLVCANGIVSNCRVQALGSESCQFVRKDNGENGRAYDSLATRLTQDEMDNGFTVGPGMEAPPNHRDRWKAHEAAVGSKLNSRDAPPLRVKSCFGGVAVYRARSLQGKRYSGGDCEHMSVNGKLDNVYIVPDFNVYYD